MRSFSNFQFKIVKAFALFFILHGLGAKLVFQIDRLGLKHVLFIHKALLLQFKVIDGVFQIADLLVQEVP